jgi:hypothetical protein
VIWHKIEDMTIDIQYTFDSTPPAMSECAYLELHNVKAVLKECTDWNVCDAVL